MDKKSFGNKLKSIMIENGLNAYQLAEKVGCSSAAIFKWLSGDFYPSSKYHLPLQNVLGCKIETQYEIYRKFEKVSRVSDWEREAIKWKARFELLVSLYESKTGEKVPFRLRMPVD